jgi:predicted metal-binding membrane protein
MLIMFAVGVMSLIDMALITLLIYMEKILPVDPNILSKAIGILFILWSIWLF